MSKLFYKRMSVAEGLRLPVSRHFHYSTFGVRGRYDAGLRTSMFICPETPGTGFFPRSSDSRSYLKFVSNLRDNQNQSFWTLLFRKEPNFDKINNLVEHALSGNLTVEQTRILSAYQNVIALAKEEEQLQRVVRAVKNYIKRNNRSQSTVSILSHYKSSIASLEHDVRATQLNIASNLNDNELELWRLVVEAFDKMAGARRIWDVYTENNTDNYQQVFFDLGIFDYIQSPFDTPILRDHNGTHYYLYPKGIIAAKSNVNFEFFHWNKISIHTAVVDTSSLITRPNFNARSSKHKKHHTDAMSNLYGTTRRQSVGELSIPTLNLRFFVNHVDYPAHFLDALNSFLDTQ